ncbi:MAG TPA: c-type cytochrome, partial [Thermodesulfobacteriota bacterium]|nr:c-type cytochrome [Thermodesulfobacteriota bacterium]
LPARGQGAGPAAPPASPLTFTHTFTGEPLDVTPQPGERVTAAVETFHRTGRNPYRDDSAAQEEGAKLYEVHCAICHGARGEGRIGPSLVDEQLVYPKNATDKGLFETIYGGAAGAMVGFRDRLSQDEILKIAAHVRRLERRGAPAPGGQP